jgi:hypothetical protein
MGGEYTVGLGDSPGTMYLCAHGGAGFRWSLIPRLAGRALLNPRIAWDLLTMTWAFRRRRWWAAPPFLPSDRTYLEWRMHTAYGDERRIPPLDDVIRFARWRREILKL